MPFAKRACRQGVLLVAHGTRDGQGREEAFQLASLVAGRLPNYVVETGFLELCAPTISEAVSSLAASEVVSISAVPLMLLAAGHVRQDVPRAVSSACERFPQISHERTHHIGSVGQVLSLSVRRYREALATQPAIPDKHTAILLIGRGSNDSRATEEMFAFSEKRSEATPAGRVETCFCAMSTPSVTEALRRIDRSHYPRVVFQPHLLFQGEMLGSIRQISEDWSAKSASSQSSLVVPHLGLDDLLARGIADLVLQKS